MVYEDPVIASDGFVYEREAIEQLIHANRASPMTRETLQPQVYPAMQNKSRANTFKEERGLELCKFVEENAAAEPALGQQAIERVREYMDKAPSLVTRQVELSARFNL